MKLFMKLFIFLLILFVFSNAYGEVVLVVSKNSKLNEVNSVELKRFFAGKTKSLAGEKVIMILQHKDSQSHKNFLKKYLGKSTQQFSKTWKKLVFTGRAKSPRTVNSDEEVIKLVSENSIYISYIDESQLTDSMKKIKIK